MDARFPQWLRTVVRKLDFLGIPNLGSLLAGMAVLAFIAQLAMPEAMMRYAFDPELILQGEVWRLFTFVFVGGMRNPIWLLFYVLYIYFVVNSIESIWGAGPLTVYVILAYFGCLLGAFITNAPINIFLLIIENISLAFGTLFPEYEMYIYFVLPVRAKWLAMLAAGFILYTVVTGDMGTKINHLCAFIPYLLFFGPYLFRTVKTKMDTNKRRRKYDGDMWK